MRVFYRISSLVLICALSGCADDDHAEPLTIVVPFAPGGGSDTYARILKKGIEDNNLSEQPVVIINMDGAGATVGSRHVKDARPDGNKVLFLHEAIVTAHYAGNAPYGPEAFDPIAATGSVAMIVAVMDDSPYRSLTELMEATREQPDTVRFAANFGAPVHFVAKQLERALPGAKFKFSPSGSGATRFHDLKGGHVDASAFSLAEYLSFRDSGMRALAVFRENRHPELPDLPTAREQGLDVVSENLFCWWAPRGTDPKRIDELADLLENAMQTDFVVERMQQQNTDIVYYRDEAFQQRIDDMVARIAAVAIRDEFDIPDFPFWMSIIVAGLGGACVLQIAVGRKREPTITVAATPDRGVSYWLPLLLVVETIGYVVLMQWSVVPFRPATIGFCIVAGLTLTRRHSFAWFGVLCGLAVSCGFGLHYLFTNVFIIDLP